jgi:hypothetical protein
VANIVQTQRKGNMQCTLSFVTQSGTSDTHDVEMSLHFASEDVQTNAGADANAKVGRDPLQHLLEAFRVESVFFSYQSLHEALGALFVHDATLAFSDGCSHGTLNRFRDSQGWPAVVDMHFFVWLA